MQAADSTRVAELNALLQRAETLVRLMLAAAADPTQEDLVRSDRMITLAMRLQAIVDAGADAQQRQAQAIGAPRDIDEFRERLQAVLANIVEARAHPERRWRGSDLDAAVRQLLDFMIAVDARPELRALYRDPSSALSRLPDRNVLRMVEQRTMDQETRVLALQWLFPDKEDLYEYGAICLGPDKLSVFAQAGDRQLRLLGADGNLRRTYTNAPSFRPDGIGYGPAERVVVFRERFLPFNPATSVLELAGDTLRPLGAASDVAVPITDPHRPSEVHSFDTDSLGRLYAVCSKTVQGGTYWWVARRDLNAWVQVALLPFQPSRWPVFGAYGDNRPPEPRFYYAHLVITADDRLLLIAVGMEIAWVSKQSLRDPIDDSHQTLGWQVDLQELEAPRELFEHSLFCRSAADGRLWALRRQARSLTQLILSDDRRQLFFGSTRAVARSADSPQWYGFVIDARNRAWVSGGIETPTPDGRRRRRAQLTIAQLLR